MALVLWWGGLLLAMVAHAAAVGEEEVGSAEGVSSGGTGLMRKGYRFQDVDSKFFKSDVLLSGESYKDELGTSARLADHQTFPALEGLRISMARLDLAPRGFNPPHEHPCVSELMFVLQGSMLVGFVDVDRNVIYQARVQAGDVFIYPRGVVHFQLNDRNDVVAIALSTFNSEYSSLARVSPFPATSCD